jgi:MFS family permease
METAGNFHSARGLASLTRSLRHRNYRLYAFGQIISQAGTWMQQVAMGWMVYRLTGSAFLLGLVHFCEQLPAFLLSPIAGLLADRVNTRRMLVFTQSMALIQALILSILVIANKIEVWHIILLSLLIGLINGLDFPFRQTFYISLVEDKEDLPNALALNSSIFNIARLVGPTLAGIAISLVGEGICFLLNAISYLAVIIALLAMRFASEKHAHGRTLDVSGLLEGFKYTFGFVPIRNIILLISIIALMGSPYLTLMPIFASDVLHGSSHTLGFLMGSIGTGALIGAIYLASQNTVIGLENKMVIATSILGVGLVAFSLSRWSALSMVILVICGMGMMVQMTAGNTIIQTIVDDDKRGRVMSIFLMAFMGMGTISNLLAGSIASRIGAPHTLLIGGIGSVFGSMLFGIIPRSA